MKNRILAVTLASVLALSMLGGCSKPADPKTNEAPGLGSDPVELPKESSVSILYSDNASYPYQADWKVLEWIKEATGVTIDIQPVPESDWDAKKELVLTGGDIPDLVARSFAKSTDIAAGLLLPISKYEDKMPNFQKYIDDNGLRDELDASRFADGNYYTMPCKARVAKIQDQQWLIRADIFEKHNIKIPTTMEELYDAGVQLKALYPDSTPITNRFGSGNIMTGFAAAYGTIAGWTIGDGMYYDHEAGAWEYAPTSEGWNQMLTFVNKCVENGVLDMEFTTLDSVVYEQRIVQGDTFMMYDWTGNIDRYNTQGKDVDPDYEVTPIYPPEGAEGHYAVAWKQPWDQGYILPASLEDEPEQLAVVLAYLDWGYTDEAETLLTFGKEGDSYTTNENGNLQFADATTDYNASYGLDNNSFAIREHADFLYGKLNADQVALFEKIAADDAVPSPNPQSPLTPEQLEEVQIYTSTLLDYVNSMMEKFIFGTEPLSNWDTFVSECQVKGSDKLVAAYAESSK